MDNYRLICYSSFDIKYMKYHYTIYSIVIIYSYKSKYLV